MRKVDFYGISRLSFDQIFRMILENTLYRILDKIFIYRFISYIIFRRRKIFLSEKEIISRRFGNVLAREEARGSKRTIRSKECCGEGEDVDETQHSTRTMQSKANFQTEPETLPLNVKH